MTGNWLLVRDDDPANVITFRDCSNTSFVRYEGAWNISTSGDQTEVRACQTITDFCVLGAAGWIV